MAIWMVLFALLDNHVPAGLEPALTPPNVVAILVRLPFLTEGMTLHEVESALGLDGYLHATYSYSYLTHSGLYPIGPDSWLIVRAVLDAKSNGFLVDVVDFYQGGTSLAGRNFPPRKKR